MHEKTFRLSIRTPRILFNVLSRTNSQVILHITFFRYFKLSICFTYRIKTTLNTFFYLYLYNFQFFVRLLKLGLIQTNTVKFFALISYLFILKLQLEEITRLKILKIIKITIFKIFVVFE